MRWQEVVGRLAPVPTFVREGTVPRPSPAFVEWLMGLPAGWVTDPEHGMTAAQQNTALGNGVLPLQAVVALDALQAGAGGEAHGFGETDIGHPAILLQLHQDVDVDAVEFH